MNARRKLIAELSEDSLGGIATLQDVDRAEKLVDAYRAEVLAEARAAAASEQLIDDTDHPSDLAYNQAVDDVVTALTRLADNEPDSTPLIVSRFDTAIEPAPEEPQVLTVGCIAEDGQPVALMLDVEARAKVAGWLVTEPDPVPDFYQRGYVYSYPRYADGYDWKFRVDTVTSSPENGERVALGWRFWKGEWEPYAYAEDDWDIHNCDPAGALIATPVEGVTV